MKKYFIIAMFSFFGFLLFFSPVLANNELSKLTQQRDRIENLKVRAVVLIELAEKKKAEEVVKILKELLLSAKTISQRIDREISDYSIEKGSVSLDIVDIGSSQKDIIFVDRKNITRNVEMAEFEIINNGDSIFIKKIELRPLASVPAGSILKRAKLYNKGKEIATTMQTSNRIVFELDNFSLSKNEKQEFSLLVDLYSMERVRREGARVKLSLENIYYSYDNKGEEKTYFERRPNIDFNEYSFYTGAPKISLENASYMYTDLGNKKSVDIIFNFSVEALGRNIYLPQNPSLCIDRCKRHTHNSFLIRETGGLVENITSTRIELKDISSVRKVSDSFLIREGETGFFELRVNIKTDIDITRSGRVILDIIPWGVDNSIGLEADILFFDELFTTKTLSEDR